MFEISTNKLIKQAHIYWPVNDDELIESNYRHFDNDGFQLNPLEQSYYRAERVEIHECLGVWAAQYPWIELKEQNNFILDHSFVVTRCDYRSAARGQLERFAQSIPYLRKYLLLRPKWGIDFALEYYTEDDYIEVLHIEQDFDTYEKAQRAKELIEQRIIHTDWNDFTRNILSRKHEWSHLQGMARNDWKAQYWGLDRAEHTLKAF